MKKLLFVVFAFMFSLNTYAYGFRANANVFVINTQAEISVYNSFYRTIVCSGDVRGLTISGQYVNAYMNNVVIHPGMYGYAYAYTNNYNPFVSASANIYCNFL